MGWPANLATRTARHEAHQAFDRLWLDATPPLYLPRKPEGRRAERARLRWVGTARRRALLWLAHQLDQRGIVHIGRMTLSQCLNVVAICEDATPDQVQAWSRPSHEPADRQRRHKKRVARWLLGPDELPAREGRDA